MPFDDRDFPDLPRGERAATPRARRLVGLWLYGIAFMILVMIGLGGATRLTGSGLSIMEWAPIMGALPPLSDAEWRRLFALYQQIPQYGLMNEGFGLEGFRHIFWLEWAHRLWGRLIGAMFLIPLIWFILTGRVERRLWPVLAGFFVLGGLQGAVGWFMVASGFAPDSIAVAPVRLVLHLVFALLLYGSVLWTAFSLLPPGRSLVAKDDAPDARLRAAAFATLSLVALTIAAGGFVAGLHAGLTYNTFPLMDGRLVPDSYADLEPFARNLVENIATVQFDHRLLATVTLLASSGLTVLVWHRSRRRAMVLMALVAVQYLLGIAVLLMAVPPDLAVMHQICAVLVLSVVLSILHAVRPMVGNPRRPVFDTGHGRTRRATPLNRSVTSSAAKEPKP